MTSTRAATSRPSRDPTIFDFFETHRKPPVGNTSSRRTRFLVIIAGMCCLLASFQFTETSNKETSQVHTQKLSFGRKRVRRVTGAGRNRGTFTGQLALSADRGSRDRASSSCWPPVDVRRLLLHSHAVCSSGAWRLPKVAESTHSEPKAALCTKDHSSQLCRHQTLTSKTSIKCKADVRLGIVIGQSCVAGLI